MARVWGSEAELTKEAYASLDEELSEEVAGCSTLGELKDKIIELKLKSNRTSSEDEQLQTMLSKIFNQVTWIKEQMVISEMNKIRPQANDEIDRKDDSVKAPIEGEG